MTQPSCFGLECRSLHRVTQSSFKKPKLPVFLVLIRWHLQNCSHARKTLSNWYELGCQDGVKPGAILWGQDAEGTRLTESGVENALVSVKNYSRETMDTELCHTILSNPRWAVKFRNQRVILRMAKHTQGKPVLTVTAKASPTTPSQNHTWGPHLSLGVLRDHLNLKEWHKRHDLRCSRTLMRQNRKTSLWPLAVVKIEPDIYLSVPQKWAGSSGRP